MVEKITTRTLTLAELRSIISVHLECSPDQVQFILQQPSPGFRHVIGAKCVIRETKP